MKRYVPILAILIVFLFASDGWAPPPSGGGGSGIPIRKVQDLLDVTKPLSPANGEGLLYGTDANKFFATDIQTATEATAHADSASDHHAATVAGDLDHGGITGLGDDDHGLYFQTDGSETATAAFNMGAYGITNTGPLTGVTTIDTSLGVNIGVDNTATYAQIAGTRAKYGYDAAAIAGGGIGKDFQLHANNVVKVTITQQYGLVGIGGTPAAQLDIQGIVAGNPVLIVQGATSQSANMVSILDSPGTVLFAINKDGNIPTVGNIASQGTGSFASTLTLTGALDANGTADFATTVDFGGTTVIEADGDILINGQKIAPPSYGGMYATDISAVVATAGVFYTVTGFETISHEVDVAVHMTNGTFTFDASSAGVYDVSATMSMTIGNNDVTHCHFAVDGADTDNGGFSRKMNGTNDIGASSMTAIMTVAAAEVLTLECSNDSDADDIDFGHITVNVNRIAP